MISEADAALAKAPSFAETRGGVSLSKLPLYLLIGPEGAGKTSALLNSGIEAQFLAGQGSGPANPTRLCNFWLAKGAIFAEIGGRVFGGELSRWTQVLRALSGELELSLWRRLWGEAAHRADLRGVIAFCDSKEFISAASDPQRLERNSRDWQERLRCIADRFGPGLPVYVVITKCDQIPFCLDFFRRCSESEVSQVLGCTLPWASAQTSRTDEVFAESEAKRLTASFRPLYQALARRRLTQLSQEPNLAQRSGAYEFPREFKRIRSPLVQFLTDAFRPYSLGPSLALRGYYLTGIRETEAELGEPSDHGMDSSTRMEATGLFRSDATQILQRDDLKPPGPGRKVLKRRAMFVTELFHRVILPDQPARNQLAAEPRLERYRTMAFMTACGVLGILCLTFFVSWWNNRDLLSEVGAALNSQTDRRGRATSLRDLQLLDNLRAQVARLEGGLPWRFHWGLYSGDRVLDHARKAYFRQFHHLLLADLNGRMVGDLEALSPTPDATAPYEPAYRTLRTHLMITSGSCPVDSGFLSRQLKDVRARIAPGAEADWQAMADRQIDFYATELARGNPLPMAEDGAARDRARHYLQQINGIDRLYTAILSNVEKSLGKTSRLSDLASNYNLVLSGPNEVSSAFTRAGWASVEKASKENSAIPLGDTCVVGGPSGAIGNWKQNSETAQAIQRKYFRDYVDNWQKFVAGFSVIKYSSAEDAAKKLEILTDRKSPLLAVFFMTANQTDFPVAPKDPGLVERGFNTITAPLKKAVTGAKVVASAPPPAPDSLISPTDISRYFQPVHVVEPPSSETWVVDKNAAYIEALVELRRSMLDIAQGGRSPDPAIHQAAAKSFDKAIDAARQISRGFKPVEVGALDVAVERLLMDPIKLTSPFIIKDMEKAGAGKINSELRALCESQKSIFRKYPFQPSSTDEINLQELAAAFHPAKGAVWKFQQQSLAELTMKEGPTWKVKDPSKKPQVTQGMMDFLNRSQTVVDVFYPGGAPQPQLTYTFRPKLDPSLKEFNLVLEIDGQPTHQWTNSLQHTFSWPPPQGSTKGAVARLRSGSNASFAFASRGGIWGIFRILGDAETRELNSKLVEWKYTSSGVGRRELIEPSPVQMEIVSFPGEQDVFNPKFWQGLGCPSAAVQ